MRTKMGFHWQRRVGILSCTMVFIVCLVCWGNIVLPEHLLKVPKESPDDGAITNGSIHLAFICGGHTSTRGLYTLMKSIIFHRTNQEIILHIFVDNVSRRILVQLFSTWKVPKFHVRLYDSLQLMDSVSWIPNEHYSGVFGLIKLVAPMKLAMRGIKRVIFLDTDILVLGDIANLHSQFFNDSLWSREERPMGSIGEREGPFIGLVENQSDWYDEVHALASKASLPWRAPGRGFNTGVMLIDLERLKNSNWEDEWRRVAFDELSGGELKVQLADQDIMNAVLKLNRDFVVQLDCKFNIQINDNTNLSETCPSHSEMGASSFRLAHWNSPKKLQTKNMYNEYYRKWYEMFENLSGDLLEATARAPLVDLVQYSPRYRKKLPASCDGIRPAPDENLRIFIDFLDYQIDEHDEHGVTLAVHLSFDRMNALDQLAANWLGPISAAVYLRESEISSFHELINDSDALAQRRNIGYHLMFRDHGQSYPINRLRNLALEQTKTPYVYLSDVDFVPALDLYKYLKDSIRDLINPTNQNSTALVVPVFETSEYKFSYPKDKAALLGQLEAGTISMFRATIWPQGQAATQYDKWKRASRLYEVKLEQDYEPFIVVHTKSVPRYDERFVGFGWNKVEHVLMLAAKNYKFYVLPEAYAVHQYHTASHDLSRYRHSRKYQSCAKDLKSLYMIELLADNPKFLAGILASSLAPEPTTPDQTRASTVI